MKTKIYKVLSILLALAVVFSACVCILGTVSAGETEYVVSSTGTYKTIDEVIKDAKDKGKGAGDVVVAKIADNDTVLMSKTSDFNTEHAFTLVITSDNGAKLQTENNGSTKRNIILGGPTEIDNVEIDVSTKSFRGNGKDFKIGHGVTFKNGYANVSCLRTGGAGQDVVVSQTSTVEVGIRPVRELQLVNDGAGALTYEKDVNIIYDDIVAGTTEQTVRLGLAGNGNVTFEGNVNLNIKAGHVKFNSANNAYIEGNVQIINSGTMTNPLHALWQTTSTGYQRWELTNTTPQYKDVLGFIADTTGKYSVAEGYTATATKGGVSYPTENGVLDLTAGGAGTYSVVIERAQTVANVTYNVDSVNGDDATTDPATTPFATIEGAVNYAINTAYVNKEGSNVTVNVLSDSVMWTVSEVQVPAHEFTLIVSSANNATVTSETGTNMGLNGPTVFENVKVSPATNKSLRFFDNNVTVGENATLGGALICIGNTNNRHNMTAGQKLVINGKSNAIYLSNDSNGNYYKSVIDVEYNNATGSQTFKFGTFSANNETEYYSNVNFKIKDAEKITLATGYTYNFKEGNAIQVILDNPETVLDFADALKTAANDYVIKNSTGVAGIVDFTETAGTFSVDTSKIPANKKLVYVNGGTSTDVTGTSFTVASGEYELKLDCTHAWTNACDTECDLGCGHTRPVTHNYENIVKAENKVSNATCTAYAVYKKSCACGDVSLTETFEDIAGGKADHTPGTEWEKDGTHHWKVCTATGCGAVIESTKTTHTPDHQGGATEEYPIKCTVCQYIMEQQLAHNHNYNQQNTAEQYKVSGATCTSPAIYNYSCSCGEEGTTTFEYGTTLPHTYDRMEATDTYKKDDATCTTQATYYYSCVCGKEGTEFFSSGELAQHNYVEEVVAPEYLKDDATCENYATYYKNCDGANCNATSPEHTFEDVAGGYGDHNAEHREETQTTQPCQAPGQIEHWVCMVCMSCFTDAACTQEVDPEDVWKMDEYTGAHSYKDGVCEWCGAPENNSGIGGDTGDNTGGNTGDNAGGNTGDAGNTGNAGDTTTGSGTGNADANTDSTENKTEEKTEDKVENKTEEKTEDKVSPQTSDVVNFTFLVALLFVSAFGVVYTSKKLKKSK